MAEHVPMELAAATRVWYVSANGDELDEQSCMIMSRQNPNTRHVPHARPSEEPGAVIPHAGICEGGVRQLASLPQSVMNMRLLLLGFFLLASIGRADESWPSQYEFLTINGAQRITPRNGIPVLSTVPKTLRNTLAHYYFGTDDEKTPNQLRGFTFDLHKDGQDEYFIYNPAASGSGGAFYYIFRFSEGSWHCIYQFGGSLHMFPTPKGWPHLVTISRGGGGMWAKTYSEFKNGKYQDTFIEHYERGTITWEKAPKE